jgi:hypothetical protein
MTTITSEWSTPVSFTVELYETLPDTEVQKIFPADGGEGDWFGENIAIDLNQTTLVVGAQKHNPSGKDNAGAAYVYVKNEGSWVLQAKLAPSTLVATDGFGYSVSISGDGNTIAVGAPYTDEPGVADRGSVFIFTRSGTTWTQRIKIVAPGGGIPTGGSGVSYGFGRCVCLNKNNGVLAVGAPNATITVSGYAAVENAGVVYVYTGSAASWSLKDTIWPNKGSVQIENGVFGRDIAMTPDGSRILVGAYFTNLATQSKARIVFFDRTGDKWNQTAVIDRPNINSDYFGISVSISDDGLVAAVGCTHDKDGTADNGGSVYVFRNTAGSWSQETILNDPDFTPSQTKGNSVSISADGMDIVAGAKRRSYDGTNNIGAFYHWRKDGSTWVMKNRITASDKSLGIYFGESVRISADGETIYAGAIAGKNAAGTGTGAVYIFN